MNGEGLKEMLDEIGGKLADGGREPGGVEDGIRPSADVQGYKSQGFIHGHVGMADAVDPFAVAQCLVKCLTQHNGRVLDGVVAVNVQVARGFHGEIKEAVNGYGREHMIQKPDSCADTVLP